VVLVEAVHDSEASSPHAGLAVVARFRYAVQVATDVGKTGEPTLDFGTPGLLRRSFSVDVAPAGAAGIFRTAADGAAAADYTLVVDIRHTGTRACRPALRLEVYSADGTLVHDAAAQRGLLYPGTSVRQTFELPPLSPGSYTVLLLADVGADMVQGAKFQVDVR
jgi:hypothetical protein